MERGGLTFEVETGPRFEIFYALHKLFAPASPAAERWRASAKARLGSRFNRDAAEIAPQPLMWAILADSTLAESRITSFEELVKAIERHSPEEFRAAITRGVPTVRGLDLAGEFTRVLADPADYRGRLLALLRTFWTRVFSADFATVRPELERIARKLRTTSAGATGENIRERLGIPVEAGAEGRLKIGRGYTLPRERVGRVVLLPSAFNLGGWWTKRDEDGSPVDLFFPVNDGTVGPNDAVTANAARRPESQPPSDRSKASRENFHPEIVFRALGDTTRYAIATILARAPATPTELSRQLKVSKPTITHHVHALRDAGLILDGVEGGKIGLDRSSLEQLSEAAVAELFSSEGKLKLSRTRRKAR